MSHKETWLKNKDLLDQLRKFDKSFQLFGAASHRYKLSPVCSQNEIDKIEEDIGIDLPSDLKEFYLYMGNGIAGPHYGLKSLNRLPVYFTPAQPYQGIQYYLENSWLDDDEEEAEQLDPDGYFEIDTELLTGLIPIIEEGCGHQTCIVASGPMLNSIVAVSNDGYLQEVDQPLSIIYQEWLIKSIGYFEKIAQLVDTSIGLDDINLELRGAFSWNNWDDLVISYIGAEKPISMFGDGLTFSKSGGHEQRAWYEEQLRRYRNNEPIESSGVSQPEKPASSSRFTAGIWSWLTGKSDPKS